MEFVKRTTSRRHQIPLFSVVPSRTRMRFAFTFSNSIKLPRLEFGTADHSPTQKCRDETLADD